MLETAALVLAIILFIAGLVGTVAPLLPGAILIYIGMLLYGFMTKFATLNIYFYLIQALALALTFIIDNVASAAGAKRFGGSSQAAWGALIGTIIGVFFGPIGIIVCSFLGAVAAEIIFKRVELRQAIRSGFGTIIGILGGTVLKLFVEILMIIYFFMKIYS
mgnify:CR=1 FL=1